MGRNTTLRARRERGAGLIPLLFFLFNIQCAMIYSAEPVATEVRRFCLAAYHGDKLDIRYYLKTNPALIQARDDEWGSGIDAAARGNHPEIIQLLIDAGADCRSIDARHLSPLHTAAINNSLEAAKLLLKEKADPNATTRLNEGDPKLRIPPLISSSPLDYAAYKGHVEMVELLLLNGGDPKRNAGGKGNSLIPACNTDPDPEIDLAKVSAAKKRVIKRFLDLGVDINDVDRYKRTPLIYAVDTLNVEIVRFLVDDTQGLQINLLPPDGSTALHYAVVANSLRKDSQKVREEIVRILLAGGADPHLKTSGGNTALDDTRDESVKRLLKDAMAKGPPSKFEDSKK